MQLLSQATTNGNSTAHENYAYLQTIYCWGTFDGATITLQASPNNSEWFDVASFTQKTVRGVGLNARYLRANISNAGASTSVYLQAE